MGLANIFKEQADKKRADDDKNNGKDRDPPAPGGSFQEPSKIVCTILGGLAASKSKRDQKLTAQRVNNIQAINTIANLRYLPLSE